MDRGIHLSWGAIRGLGEVFCTIFGLFIVGRLVWYLVKVVMNCGYIHSAHGCSPYLAWSFCTEVLFTHHYQKTQRRLRPNVVSGRSNNDPSERPLKRRRTVPESIKNVLSCSCIDDLRPSDSDEELHNSPAGQALRQEMAEILNHSVRRQEEQLASTRRVQANVEAINRNVDAFKRLERLPPPYVTPPSSSIIQSEAVVHRDAPRISPMRNQEAESEWTSYEPDPTGRSYGRMVYSRVPPGERFNFTSAANSPLPNPTDTLDDSS